MCLGPVPEISYEDGKFVKQFVRNVVSGIKGSLNVVMIKAATLSSTGYL